MFRSVLKTEAERLEDEAASPQCSVGGVGVFRQDSVAASPRQHVGVESVTATGEKRQMLVLYKTSSHRQTTKTAAHLRHLPVAGLVGWRAGRTRSDVTTEEGSEGLGGFCPYTAGPTSSLVAGDAGASATRTDQP